MAIAKNTEYQSNRILTDDRELRLSSDNKSTITAENTHRGQNALAEPFLSIATNKLFPDASTFTGLDSFDNTYPQTIRKGLVSLWVGEDSEFVGKVIIDIPLMDIANNDEHYIFSINGLMENVADNPAADLRQLAEITLGSTVDVISDSNQTLGRYELYFTNEAPLTASSDGSKIIGGRFPYLTMGVTSIGTTISYNCSMRIVRIRQG